MDAPHFNESCGSLYLAKNIRWIRKQKQAKNHVVHLPRPRSAEEFLKLKRKQKMCVVHFEVRLVLGCDLFFRVMLFTCPQHETAKKLVKQQDGNVVHFDIYCGSFALVFAVHSRP